MPTEILVALISALGAVVAATVAAVASVKVNRKIDVVKQDAAAVRDQVENSHKTNLRVESDSRHEETRRWFEGLSRDVGGLRSELRNLREVDLEQAREISGVRTEVSDIDDKLDRHLTETADLIAYVRNKKEKDK